MTDMGTQYQYTLFLGVDMYHSFDVDFAKEYGVLEAVLINNILYWLKKNEANRTHFYDGKYWTYNSARAFQELFPYATKRQIEYALKKLKDRGVIDVGNYNKDPRDRTAWYTFTDEFVTCKLQNCDMQEQNFVYADTQDVTPLPDINTDINTNINKRSSSTGYAAIIDAFTDNEELRTSLIEFAKMRKMIKKPLTDNALNLIIKKLSKLSSDEDEQIAIINQSIENSWQGIFPLMESRQVGANGIKLKANRSNDLDGIL